MKKLLVLAFSAIFIFVIATASFAVPVTFGGELNFGKSWMQINKTGDEQSNVSNAKVSFTAQIADDIKAYVTLKGDVNNIPTSYSVAVDEAWAQFTEDYGTVKVGYFGYNKNQKDIINAAIPDVKSGLTVSFETKLTDQLTLNLAAANKGFIDDWWDWGYTLSGDGLDYSAGLAYAADSFGGDINFFKYAGNDNAAYSINLYYKLDDLKFYAQYENGSWGSAARDFIIGGVYDSADFPLFVRAEYDFDDQNYERGHNWAIRLAYKMNPNVKFQYTLQYNNGGFVHGMDYWDGFKTNELLLITTF